ncbi:protein ALP1-like [Raphanus sativus]|uniref:Protein ALP1-like n=1 Tax=Raphanus sativus TaxID=3726 RepID=A0A6J0LJ46_RAPSA|nr:protein ALP1-like [Raphanus sativus]
MASSSHNEDFDKPFDEAFDQYFDHHFDQAFESLYKNYGDQEEVKKTRKKRIVIERNREEGHLRLWNDYFSDSPTYQENQFRRRFRMNKSLFMRIVDRLSNDVQYFRQTEDVTGRSGLSTLQKCTAAIRVLAYGSALDAVDEYIRLAASTARLCVENFVEAIIDLFGDQYLRRPTQDDLQRLLHQGEIRGFPGMIGSIDCMHWEWKNCPTTWKGQFSRGSRKPTIVLEAVADYDLWIWHAFFGLPGTLNDINVLDRSPVFDDIIYGQAPQVNFSVNGNPYSMAYYLTDGIYPKWATFIQSIKLPQGPKAALFANKQEAVRKDVERAFGVLQARFAIVKNPARCWDIVKIGKIMRACIILHNMIVENERVDGTQHDLSGFQQGEDDGSSSVNDDFSIDSPPNIADEDSVRISILDKKAHQRLKRDLVEHIWRKFGRDQHNN